MAEKLLQRPYPPRSADDPQVQAERHQFGIPLHAFAVDLIKIALGIAEPLVRGHRRIGPHFHVVGIELVRDDGNRFPRHRVPVPERHVAGIIVHMIGKAFLDQQAAGVVGVKIARQPAIGPNADGFFNRGHGLADELSLLRFVHLELVDPAPAVADRFMAEVGNRSGDFGMIFQTEGGHRPARRDVKGLQQLDDARGPGLDAVAIIAFVAIIANWRFDVNAEFVDRLHPAIPSGDGHFAAFFDIDHHRQGHFRAVWPVDPFFAHQCISSPPLTLIASPVT